MVNTGCQEWLEGTLDPVDWEQLRSLGHVMIDDVINYLSRLRERPVWQSIPDDILDALSEPLPIEGEALGKIYDQFIRCIMPYPMGNIHPRFWGWVIGCGNPVGIFADMLSSCMNSTVGGGDHVPNYIELRVLEWIKQLMDYPPKSAGLLVSGCSMANLIALTVARTDKLGFDIREEGILSIKKPVRLYGSSEMHFSLQKAVELLGLGNKSLCRIPVTSNYKIDVKQLDEKIETDLASGYRPFCVIGNAGSVNTGAIDPLESLGEIASRYGLWFHVDGAFGAWTKLSPDLCHLVRGIEKADSIALDLHKWMYLPYEVGCVLVRNRESHRRSFSLETGYLETSGDKLAAHEMAFRDYGIELSRGFRALKVWMCLKAYGVTKLGRLIRQNVQQAAYLANVVEKSAQLELLASVDLNIVCFRFRTDNLQDAQLNMINKNILSSLRNSGTAILSGVTLNGKYALRCAIVNHRSRKEDFDLLVSKVIEFGSLLACRLSDMNEKLK